MAGKPIGTVFVELDLDAKGYTKKQKEILKQTQSTSLDIETNWRRIGQQSDKMYDAMRQNVNNAYNSMVNSGKLSAAEMVRAEQAKAAKIQSINEQQYGKQIDMVEKLKNNWMTAAAAITGAYFAISKAWDLASQRAQYEQSKEAFRSMAQSMGADAEAVFGRVRKLSGGLIDDASLTQSMNKALSLGIPIEKLGDLMLIARAKSRDMGITATQAFNDIATGIGRGSPLILDNLGLMLKLGSANEAMARNLGKTVEQLTDKEKKTAILNATLEAGKEALSRYNLEVLTTKERMDSLSAQFINIKNVAGDVILRIGAGLMGTFQSVAAFASGVTSLIMAPISVLAEATDYMGITTGKAEEYRQSMEAMAASSLDLATKATANFELMKKGFQSVAPASVGRRPGGVEPPPDKGAGDKTADEYFKRQIKLLESYSDALALFYGDEAELSKMAAEEEIKAFEARQKAREADAKGFEKYAADRIAMLEGIQNAQRAEMEMTESEKPYSARDAYDAAYAYGNVALAIEQINSGLGEQWAQLEAGQSMIDLYKTAWLDANLAIYDSVASLYTGMQGWISSSLQGVIEGTMTAADAVKGLGKMMLSVIAEYVAKWAVSRMAMAVMGKAYQAAEVASAMIAGPAIAAAYAPAAAMVSLATLGSNAVPAAAGISSTVGLAQLLSLPKLAEGGIVNSPTVALIGEKGPEAVIPLDSGGAGQTINLYIDGDRLASWIHRASRQGRINLVPA